METLVPALLFVVGIVISFSCAGMGVERIVESNK